MPRESGNPRSGLLVQRPGIGRVVPPHTLEAASAPPPGPWSPLPGLHLEPHASHPSPTQARAHAQAVSLGSSWDGASPELWLLDLAAAVPMLPALLEHCSHMWDLEAQVYTCLGGDGCVRNPDRALG